MVDTEQQGNTLSVTSPQLCSQAPAALLLMRPQLYPPSTLLTPPACTRPADRAGRSRAGCRQAFVGGEGHRSRLESEHASGCGRSGPPLPRQHTLRTAPVAGCSHTAGDSAPPDGLLQELDGLQVLLPQVVRLCTGGWARVGGWGGVASSAGQPNSPGLADPLLWQHRWQLSCHRRQRAPLPRRPPPTPSARAPTCTSTKKRSALEARPASAASISTRLRS